MSINRRQKPKVYLKLIGLVDWSWGKQCGSSLEEILMKIFFYLKLKTKLWRRVVGCWWRTRIHLATVKAIDSTQRWNYISNPRDDETRLTICGLSNRNLSASRSFVTLKGNPRRIMKVLLITSSAERKEIFVVAFLGLRNKNCHKFNSDGDCRATIKWKTKKRASHVQWAKMFSFVVDALTNWSIFVKESFRGRLESEIFFIFVLFKNISKKIASLDINYGGLRCVHKVKRRKRFSNRHSSPKYRNATDITSSLWFI